MLECKKQAENLYIKNKKKKNVVPTLRYCNLLQNILIIINNENWIQLLFNKVVFLSLHWAV